MAKKIKLESIGDLKTPLSSHQPNGDMCCACIHSLKDCSKLRFSSMKGTDRVSWDNGQSSIVVICSGYLGKKENAIAWEQTNEELREIYKIWIAMPAAPAFGTQARDAWEKQMDELVRKPSILLNYRRMEIVMRGK